MKQNVQTVKRIKKSNHNLSKYSHLLQNVIFRKGYYESTSVILKSTFIVLHTLAWEVLVVHLRPRAVVAHPGQLWFTQVRSQVSLKPEKSRQEVDLAPLR